MQPERFRQQANAPALHVVPRPGASHHQSAISSVALTACGTVARQGGSSQLDRLAAAVGQQADDGLAKVLQRQRRETASPAHGGDPMLDHQPGGEPELAAVLQQFPPVAHAFAYGSGVFRQPGLYRLGSGDRPMLDFIFAVDAPAQWHAQVRCIKAALCVKGCKSLAVH